MLCVSISFPFLLFLLKLQRLLNVFLLMGRSFYNFMKPYLYLHGELGNPLSPDFNWSRFGFSSFIKVLALGSSEKFIGMVFISISLGILTWSSVRLMEKVLFCFCWADLVISVLDSTHELDWIYWQICIEWSWHLWNDVRMIIVNDFLMRYRIGFSIILLITCACQGHWALICSLCVLIQVCVRKNNCFKEST